MNQLMTASMIGWGCGGWGWWTVGSSPLEWLLVSEPDAKVGDSPAPVAEGIRWLGLLRGTKACSSAASGYNWFKLMLSNQVHRWLSARDKYCTHKNEQLNPFLYRFFSDWSKWLSVTCRPQSLHFRWCYSQPASSLPPAQSPDTECNTYFNI